MSNVLTIHTLEELKAFLNENNIMEIAVRSKNKRFKAIQKVVIDSLEGQEKELAQKAAQLLNKHNIFNKNALNILNNVAHLEKFGLLLNGLNLCATCAGFAIMYAKLEKMSVEIKQQIDQVDKDLKGVHGVQVQYEFDKVLADHTNMLDCERKQQPYSEEQMRQLVDSEYNVLMLLIASYQKNVTDNNENLIFTIFSLLAMFTVSLRKFDEIYYFKNHKAIGNNDPWHLAHNKWMSVYSALSQDWFIERLQDYGTFEASMTIAQVDAYYSILLEQVSDLREEVEDNQALIKAFGNMDSFNEYKRLSKEDIANTIKEAFREASESLPEDTVTNAFNDVMQNAALA